MQKLCSVFHIGANPVGVQGSEPHKNLVVGSSIIIILGVHQHKAACLKIKLSKIKTVATASHSVTIVLWKETAFPH